MPDEGSLRDLVGERRRQPGTDGGADPSDSPLEATLPLPAQVERDLPNRGAVDDLIRRCQQGEMDAFEEIVHLFQRRVLTLVHHMVGGVEAEDLAQDVFVKIWKALPRFRFESKFETWLYRITLNRCYDHLRSRKRSETVPLDEPDQPEAARLTDPGPLPDRSAEKGEARSLVHEALSRLSPDHRAALMMRDLEDRSYEEIAAVAGCAVGTVKSRIFRARAEFRRSYHPPAS